MSPEQRSALMAKVKSKGNRSTEVRVVAALEKEGLSGWMQHPNEVAGHPDFFFPQQKVALFIDGCFWHSCPLCGRMPKSRVDFWKAKIEGNKARDESVTLQLLSCGFDVLRIWEHELKEDAWLGRLIQMLGENKIEDR